MSRRRGPGIKGLDARKLRAAKAKQTGAAVQEMKMENIQEQLEGFKTALEAFAAKHRKEINKSPAFRVQFQTMCAKIGVDPLASSKGFWAELLGIGDFYYELAVQISEVCMSSRKANGGLIDMNDLIGRLRTMRGSNAQDISVDDVERAIQKLAILGSGYKVLDVGTRKLVQSVPVELNTDHATVLSLCENNGGFVTLTSLEELAGWQRDRSLHVLDVMMREGIVWIDDQAEEREFWVPSLL